MTADNEGLIVDQILTLAQSLSDNARIALARVLIQGGSRVSVLQTQESTTLPVTNDLPPR